MTNFDYNNLTNSTFANTEVLMRAPANMYKHNDLATLEIAMNLYSKYGSNGAIAYCERYAMNAERQVLRADQNSRTGGVA